MDRWLGRLASFTEQKWLPSGCLAVILIWTAFFIFLAYGSPILFPAGEGALGGVIEDLRVFCLGWDPRTGTYRFEELLMVLLPAPVLTALVAFVWPGETRDLARRLARAAGSRAGIITLLLLGAALTALGLSLGRERPDALAAPRGWEPAPDFRLIDSSGETVSLRDMRGSVVLLTFTYSQCRQSCPTILRRVDEVMAGAGTPSVRAVSVTVDPERDTPRGLGVITRTWRLQHRNWSFLTGEPAEVEDVLDRYAVGRQRDPVTGMVGHTNVLVIIDREGRQAYRVNPLVTSVPEMVELARGAGD